MKKISLVILMALIAACDQFDMKDKNKPSASAPSAIETPVVTVRSEDLESFVKVAITGADPEKYTVQFSWPVIEDGKIIRIRLGNVLQEVLPKQTFFTHLVNHNQTLNYSFDVLDNNRNPLKTFRKTVIVPYDFVSRISEGLSNSFLTEQTNISANRVYLSQEVPLTINGQIVNIVANEIHAEKGFIQSYPDGWLTPPGRNGRYGGSLFITANKVFGVLRVTMRGENGGQGLGGESYPRANIGRPAGDGDFENDPENGHYGCRSMGEDAGNGDPGQNGRTGGDGFRGGDSGNVRISIKEYVPADGVEIPKTGDPSVPIQIILIAGTEGAGGEPGPPQQGGEGGVGNSGQRTDCRGKPGNPGPDGKPSSVGHPGKPGNMGVKCVYLGSENVNECSQ